MIPPRLQLSGIRKVYPSVVANDSVDLSIAAGEIHAVLGENGAGKSTLMKIIYGVVKPDAGKIEWEGTPVAIANPARARRLGIGMVFQHFSLFETLTVAENIALALPVERAGPDLPARIREVSAKYGLPLDPGRVVHSMSVGERQRVEVVRCLLQDPKLLIMDEPTSVLTPQAVSKLFETLRRLAADGVAILYISHKLAEIQALCQRATVMRNGKVTGTCDPRQETTSSLARMMIGAELPRTLHRDARARAACLDVRQLSLPADDPFGTELVDIDLAVHAAEIVGIAGVSGNGQRELLAALSGERKSAVADAIQIAGAAVGHLDAGGRRALGLAFVPEERLGRGAVPDLPLTANSLLTAHHRGLTGSGFIRDSAVRAYTLATIREFNVKTAGPDAAARSLSGGNLQKFIVGREIRQQPKLLIVAQPTWGVDVGAAAQIRQTLIDLRDAGVAVLVVSEEVDELYEICDRVAVIAQGRLSPVKPLRETSAAEIGLLMAGAFVAPRAAAVATPLPNGSP